MIDDKQISNLEKGLQRLFGLHVSRLTLRELQNLLMALTHGNKDVSVAIFDSLLTGQIKEGAVQRHLNDKFQHLIEQYTIRVRLAKDVFERGDFLNLIVSDIVNDRDEAVFVHRIRKMDGDESLFVTEPASMIHLLQHFTARLEEFKQSPNAKAFFDHFKDEWKKIGHAIGQLGAS